MITHRYAFSFFNVLCFLRFLMFFVLNANCFFLHFSHLPAVLNSYSGSFSSNSTVFLIFRKRFIKNIWSFSTQLMGAICTFAQSTKNVPIACFDCSNAYNIWFKNFIQVFHNNYDSSHTIFLIFHIVLTSYF